MLDLFLKESSAITMSAKEISQVEKAISSSSSSS